MQLTSSFSLTLLQAERLHRNFSKLYGKYGEDEIPMEKFAAELMKDTIKADMDRLPNICSPDWELGLSSIFVQVDTPLVRLQSANN